MREEEQKAKGERRKTKLAIAAALPFLGGALLVGCEVGPNYKRPQVPIESHWGELSSPVAGQPATLPATGPATQGAPPSVATTRPVALTEWWTTFNDPELNSLIRRAVESNLDLKEAQQRVAEARYQRAIAGAGLYPQVNLDGSYEHAHVSKNGIPIPGVGVPTPPSNNISSSIIRPNAASRSSSSSSSSNLSGLLGIPADVDLYQVGFDASWELDFFGGQRRNVETANATYQASIEDRRDVLLSLLAEVAVNYVDLRGAQRQLAIALDNLKTQQQTLMLTRERQRAGVVTELDVDRAASEVASTSARIPQLQRQERQMIHALGLLLGQSPDYLIQELSKPLPTPAGPAEVPVGLPSDLLRRRPDIRRAERQLAAQSARIGVATADFFPKFSLTGDASFQSLKPEQLFEANSFTGTIGPSVSWPIFDAGRIRANVHLQGEREKEYYYAYQKTVLGALRDVEDALVAYSTEQMRRRALADAVEADTRAVNIANQQYHQGVIDFLTVLDAERSLFASQDALADSDRTVATNLIALYKALGGGWQIETHQN